MKILLIDKAFDFAPSGAMWESLGRHCELDRMPFGEADRRDLAFTLSTFDFRAYDRVLMWQHLRVMGAQYRALRAIPNLVFLEQDACQHFVPESPWHGKYETVLRDIGRIRVLVSNLTCKQVFQSAGIDAAYLPKAYDATRISCLGRPRDIEFAHIGHMGNKVYKERRRLLETIGKRLNVQLLVTEGGDFTAYNEMLNRIRFFISADVGFKEYMSKNFEAMAAGCVLVAKRQPAIEQEALGFVDMENLVLYDGAGELLAKVGQLQANPARADRIADAGRRLVEERHTMQRRGHELYDLLVPEIQPAPPPSTWDMVRCLRIRFDRSGTAR